MTTTISATLVKAGASQYLVRDYWGNTVVSGNVLSTSFSSTRTWLAGWYRLYLTGSNTDSLFGTAYGSGNFIVINSDAHFVTNPAAGTPASLVDSGSDQVAKGVLGLGAERWEVLTANAPGNIPGHVVDIGSTETYWLAIPDAARLRYSWVAFPNGSVDQLVLPNATSGVYVRAFCKDNTVDGSKVFVSIGAGTSSGAKIQVHYPDAATLVETYDNLATAAAAQTAVDTTTPSSYIRVFVENSSTSPGSLTPTAIGNAFSVNVSSTVATLYAAGATRFEGPSNEPSITAQTAPGYAHRMSMFTQYVHAGNASAKAIGPSLVDIGPVSLPAWSAFFDACNAISFVPDGIAFHAYNVATNGDLNLGRTNLAAFIALIVAKGFGSLERWQTESTQATTAVFGVHHPRRARLTVFSQLLMEQYGIPREQNNPWYTLSNGFWAFPAFWETGGGSLQPQAAMGRTLAEQTWGQPYSSAITFGKFADNFLLGNIYLGSTAKTAVVVATSYMPNSTVTFSTSAAGPLTIVDAFGNSSTATVSAGKFTVTVTEIPIYIKLGTTDTLTVSSVNDWGAATYRDIAPYATCAVGATSTTVPISGTFMSDYVNQVGIYKSANSLPEAVVLTWPTQQSFDRVVIWCGSAWQSNSTFLTFTIDGSNDGSTWTNLKTVDVSSTATSFPFGSDSTDLGCSVETYWPEQWVFDETLTPGTLATYLRVNVTATSYGGEPTQACITAGGQGVSSQHIALQRLSVLSTSSQPVGFASSSYSHKPAFGPDTIVLNRPAETQDGDFLLAFVSVLANGPVATAPAGWTSLSSNSSGPYAGVWYKTASSEPSTYTWSINSETTGCIIRYSGVTGINASSINRTSATTTVTASTITTTQDGCFLVFLASSNAAQSGAYTGPTGFTQHINQTSSNDVPILFAEMTQATHGATGAVTATAATSTGQLGILVALK